MSGGRPFELRRRRRRAGALRLRGSGEPRTWAAAQWLALMDALVAEEERRPGLEAARRGDVESLQIGSGGVEAQVRGMAPLPYRVHLVVPALSAEEWARVVEAMAQEAFYVAKLLSRDVPPAIDALLEPLGLALLPAAHEILAECACPSGGRCRHAAAAMHLVAGMIDEDPLTIFSLRGMNGERLLERLHAAREHRAQGASAAHAEPVPPQSVLDATRPLEQCMDSFWHPGPQLAEIQHMPPPHHAPHALLRRLGPSPLPGRFPMVGLLASVYDEVARHALALRDRAEGIDTGAPPGQA